MRPMKTSFPISLKPDTSHDSEAVNRNIATHSQPADGAGNFKNKNTQRTVSVEYKKLLLDTLTRQSLPKSMHNTPLPRCEAVTLASTFDIHDLEERRKELENSINIAQKNPPELEEFREMHKKKIVGLQSALKEVGEELQIALGFENAWLMTLEPAGTESRGKTPQRRKAVAKWAAEARCRALKGMSPKYLPRREERLKAPVHRWLQPAAKSELFGRDHSLQELGMREIFDHFFKVPATSESDPSSFSYTKGIDPDEPLFIRRDARLRNENDIFAFMKQVGRIDVPFLVICVRESHVMNENDRNKKTEKTPPTAIERKFFFKKEPAPGTPHNCRWVMAFQSPSKDGSVKEVDPTIARLGQIKNVQPTGIRSAVFEKTGMTGQPDNTWQIKTEFGDKAHLFPELHTEPLPTAMSPARTETRDDIRRADNLIEHRNIQRSMEDGKTGISNENDEESLQTPAKNGVESNPYPGNLDALDTFLGNYIRSSNTNGLVVMSPRTLDTKNLMHMGYKFEYEEMEKPHDLAGFFGKKGFSVLQKISGPADKELILEGDYDDLPYPLILDIPSANRSVGWKKLSPEKKGVNLITGKIYDGMPSDFLKEAMTVVAEPFDLIQTEICPSDAATTLSFISQGNNEAVQLFLSTYIQNNNLSPSDLNRMDVISHIFSRSNPDTVFASYELGSVDKPLNAHLGSVLDQCPGYILEYEYERYIDKEDAVYFFTRRLYYDQAGSPETDAPAGMAIFPEDEDEESLPSALLNKIRAQADNELRQIRILSPEPLNAAVAGITFNRNEIPASIPAALATLQRAGMQIDPDDEAIQRECMDFLFSRYAACPLEATNAIYAGLAKLIGKRDPANPEARVTASQWLTPFRSLRLGAAPLGCIVQFRHKEQLKIITFYKAEDEDVYFKDLYGNAHLASDIDDIAEEQDWNAEGPIDILNLTGKSLAFYEEENAVPREGSELNKTSGTSSASSYNAGQTENGIDKVGDAWDIDGDTQFDGDMSYQSELPPISSNIPGR